jgi:hypothetical protein
LEPPEIRSASNEAMKEALHEGSFLSINQGRELPRKPPVREALQQAWSEDVKARAKKGSPEGRRVRLNVDVDESVHLRMKLWCIKNGYKFNEMIPALMTAFLEAEKE